MQKIIIVAKAENNVIGKNNDLVWKLPKDLRFFKEKTKGHTLIMGRKTFEALGGPLPERKHIVLTHQKDYNPEGCVVVHSLDEAYETAKKEKVEQVFIIGGAEIYKQALPHTDRMYITEVKAEPEGDAYFPEYDTNNWKEVWREAHDADEKHEHAFVFTELVRIR